VVGVVCKKYSGSGWEKQRKLQIVSVKCLGYVQKMCGKCLKGFEKFPVSRSVREVSGKCPGSVKEVSEEVSGKCAGSILILITCAT
jgi:hypothetical protein